MSQLFVDDLEKKFKERYLFDMKNTLSNIGQRIRKIRTKCGLSQTALGEKLGLTGAAISKYENGESDAGALTLEKIAKIGNRSLDWLITGDEPKNITSPQGLDEESGPLRPIADMRLITEVIEAVMEHLQDNNLTMPPAKIAALVEVLYGELNDSGGEQVKKKTVARLIKLAS